MSRRRLEWCRRRAGLVFLLALMPVLYPEIVEVFKGPQAAPQLVANLMHGTHGLRLLFEPGAGRSVLPARVLLHAEMLRRHGAQDFYCSTKLLGAYRGTGYYQRLLEGVYPARYSASSRFLFMQEGERIPSSCRELESREGVRFVFCGA